MAWLDLIPRPSLARSYPSAASLPLVTISIAGVVASIALVVVVLVVVIVVVVVQVVIENSCLYIGPISRPTLRIRLSVTPFPASSLHAYPITIPGSANIPTAAVNGPLRRLTIIRFCTCRFLFRLRLQDCPTTESGKLVIFRVLGRLVGFQGLTRTERHYWGGITPASSCRGPKEDIVGQAPLYLGSAGHCDASCSAHTHHSERQPLLRLPPTSPHLVAHHGSRSAPSEDTVCGRQCGFRFSVMEATGYECL